jgi:hypothetical protein
MLMIKKGIKASMEHPTAETGLQPGLFPSNFNSTNAAIVMTAHINIEPIITAVDPVETVFGSNCVIVCCAGP